MINEFNTGRNKEFNETTSQDFNHLPLRTVYVLNHDPSIYNQKSIVTPCYSNQLKPISLALEFKTDDGDWKQVYIIGQSTQKGLPNSYYPFV